MRLGGRLAAAIEILDDIEARDSPAADALKEWGLAHRFAGAGDRAAIGNIVHDALRRKRAAGWLLDADTSRARAIGALVLEWGMDGAEIARALEDDRFAPARLSAAELHLLGSRRLEDAPDPVRADCPDWCVPLAEEAFGEAWVQELAGLATRPPLDLRVNTLASTREEVLAALEGTGAAACALAAAGLRIPPVAGSGRHPNLQTGPAFTNGWFEIQDEGSQLAAALAGAQAGMQVLDYCAGAGGKTLAMSAAMENSGQIFAHDADRRRLTPIFERLRRAGSRNVQVVARQADLQTLAGRMDLVLVDAPCTGSGTWRRRPDTKWRLSSTQLETRRAEQATILEHAAAFVKPGGRIAYVTCSIFPDENGHQIETFLATDPDFSPIAPEGLWQAATGESGKRVRFAGGGIVMSPAGTDTDGFFFAAMQRKPG